jgi:hypothetical protein
MSFKLNFYLNLKLGRFQIILVSGFQSSLVSRIFSYVYTYIVAGCSTGNRIFVIISPPYHQNNHPSSLSLIMLTLIIRDILLSCSGNHIGPIDELSHSWYSMNQCSMNCRLMNRCLMNRCSTKKHAFIFVWNGFSRH